MNREPDIDIHRCDWCGDDEDDRQPFARLHRLDGELVQVTWWLCDTCRPLVAAA